LSWRKYVLWSLLCFKWWWNILSWTISCIFESFVCMFVMFLRNAVLTTHDKRHFQRITYCVDFQRHEQCMV
jgi:cytochrome b subunit of formate dehydrogenase